MSALIHFLLPEADLALFIVLYDLKNVLVKFVDIFVFLTLGDPLAQRVNFLEGLADSVLKSAAPGECTGYRWIIVVDGGLLVVLIDKGLALKEHSLNCLKVLFVHVEKDCVFLFKLILDDGRLKSPFLFNAEDVC